MTREFVRDPSLVFSESGAVIAAMVDADGAPERELRDRVSVRAPRRSSCRAAGVLTWPARTRAGRLLCSSRHSPGRRTLDAKRMPSLPSCRRASRGIPIRFVAACARATVRAAPRAPICVERDLLEASPVCAHGK